MKLRPLKPLQSNKPIAQSFNIKLPAWVDETKAREFVKKNRAGIAAGGVIGGVLIIFLLLTARHQSTVEVRSSAIFREGQALYQYRIPPSGGGEAAVVSSDEEKFQRCQQYFVQIIENYPGSRYAPPALYYVANCRYRLRQYASALEAFDQFLSRFSRNHLAMEAMLGRADTLEQLGRHQEALESYRKVIASKGPLVSEASLGAVRCLLKMTEVDRPNANKWWGEAAGILQGLASGKDPYGQKASRMLQKLLVDLSKSK